VRESELDAADGVESRELLARERDRRRVEGLAELLGAPGADDRDDGPRPLQQPRDRDLARRVAALRRDA